MRTPKQAAALLVTGTLSRTAWPEFADDDFADEVRQRLAEVGLELVPAAGRWLARARDTTEADGHEPTFELHQVELAMIAVLYLHLCYLPRRAQDPMGGAAGEPSVDVEDVVGSFPGHQRGYLEKIVLGRLRNTGFVVRESGRLYAGPYLAALDEVEADRRCTEVMSSFQLARHLRRRAEQIERDVASAPSNGSG